MQECLKKEERTPKIEDGKQRRREEKEVVGKEEKEMLENRG